MTLTTELPVREPPPDSDDSVPLRQLLRVVGRSCPGCSGRCLAREIVWSIALGFPDAPRCLPCLARGLGRNPTELQAQLADYARRRKCYSAAWAEACRLDGGVPPATTGMSFSTGADGEASSAVDETAWDAGPLACGELALALRAWLSPLPPGAVVRVRATDFAAAEDVPAWCRLTGHALLSASPPEYRIRRKGV